MAIKPLDIAASLETAHAGNLGVMAVLALCSSIIMVSLGRPLVDWKLGEKRKKKQLETCGVKAILANSDAHSEQAEASETMQYAGPAEKDVYESVVLLNSEVSDSDHKEKEVELSDSGNKEKMATASGSSKRSRALSKSAGPARPRSKQDMKKENAPRVQNLIVDNRKQHDDAELISLSNWNARVDEKKAEITTSRHQQSNLETPPSSCLLFVGSFRTKGDREAQAVCLAQTEDVCPYCSYPLAGPLAPSKKKTGSKHPSVHSQLQSKIKSLGLRTMAKRIGPDPKETRRFIL